MKADSLPNLNREITSVPSFISLPQDVDHNVDMTLNERPNIDHGDDTEASETSPFNDNLSLSLSPLVSSNEIGFLAAPRSVVMFGCESEHTTSSVGSNQISCDSGGARSEGTNPTQMDYYQQPQMSDGQIQPQLLLKLQQQQEAILEQQRPFLDPSQSFSRSVAPSQTLDMPQAISTSLPQAHLNLIPQQISGTNSLQNLISFSQLLKLQQQQEAILEQQRPFLDPSQSFSRSVAPSQTLDMPQAISTSLPRAHLIQQHLIRFSHPSQQPKQSDFPGHVSHTPTSNQLATAGTGTWAPPPSQFQRMRTYTMVYKTGSVGRSIDVTRYSGYEELRQDLARIFGIEGQLEDRHRVGCKLVYVDHGRDILQFGDDPWEEFVNYVWYIKILSPQEVQVMSLDGDFGNSVLPNQACSTNLQLPAAC